MANSDEPRRDEFDFGTAGETAAGSPSLSTPLLPSCLTIIATAGALVLVTLVTPDSAPAEYGDVVINNPSEKSGMRPAVFPHWFHRVRFKCKVCHGDLGFEFEAGGNDITMLKIIDGQYCGACHDGQIAWSVENCDLCHTGKPSLPTQVHGSTLQKLVAPVSPPLSTKTKNAPAPVSATNVPAEK